MIETPPEPQTTAATGTTEPDRCQTCLSVIMPVYNEEKTIGEVIETVLGQPLVGEIICVDDCSTDGSLQLLRSLKEKDGRIRVETHSKNRGKGAALKTGIALAREPIVIIQDADLEYDPTEFPKMVGPILQNHADVVFGSRFIGSEARRVLYFWHAVGNRFLTVLSNMFTNLNLTDMETCYKAFRREIIQKIEIQEDRFGFEPEITAKVAGMAVRVYEVAISYKGRTYAEGKKVGWRDGFSAMRCIVKYGMLTSSPEQAPRIPYKSNMQSTLNIRVVHASTGVALQARRPEASNTAQRGATKATPSSPRLAIGVSGNNTVL